MRKILTIALVALMAASLFAGVKTSGYVQGSLTSFFFSDSDAVWFVPDSDNKAEASITDENGVWGTTIYAQNFGVNTKNYTKSFSPTKALAKNTTWVDILKLAKIDSDFGLKATLLLGQKNAALKAYTGKADVNNYQKLESTAGTGFDVEAKYSNVAAIKVGVHLFDYYPTKANNTELASYLVSAKLTPVKGVAVAGGYKIVSFDKNRQSFTINGDVNLGKLANLGFDFGAGAAYKFIKDFTYDTAGNVTGVAPDVKDLAVEIYGGYKGLSAYGEMEFIDGKNLKLGAAYAFTERADAGVYVNWSDYKNADFKENVKMGIQGNYKATKNIGLYARLEYVAKTVVATGRCKVTF